MHVHLLQSPWIGPLKLACIPALPATGIAGPVCLVHRPLWRLLRVRLQARVSGAVGSGEGPLQHALQRVLRATASPCTEGLGHPCAPSCCTHACLWLHSRLVHFTASIPSRQLQDQGLWGLYPRPRRRHRSLRLPGGLWGQHTQLRVAVAADIWRLNEASRLRSCVSRCCCLLNCRML